MDLGVMQNVPGQEIDATTYSRRVLLKENKSVKLMLGELERDEERVRETQGRTAR